MSEHYICLFNIVFMFFTFLVKVVDRPQLVNRVWRYFERIDGGRAKCNLCGDSYSCTGYKTSNLWKHLRALHPVENRSLNKRKEIDTDDVNGRFTKERVHKEGVNKSSFNKKECDDLLVAFICNLYLPFCIVENSIFIEFVKYLNPANRLPSRAVLSNTMVPEFSRRLDQVVNEELDKASDITLTTDGWTSKATKNYLGVCNVHVCVV